VNASIDTLQEHVDDCTEELGSRLDDHGSDILQISNEVNYAHACWARRIEWTAEVDAEQLDRDGKVEVTSKLFTAGGLRGLQLCLKIASSGKHYVCGGYLRAPEGKVAFRLRIGKTVQNFTGIFNDAPEWGSQRIAVLDKVGPTVMMRLDILDVSTPVLKGPELVSVGRAPALPSGITGGMQIADAKRAATQEVEVMQSRMVRKIEWKIARISERIKSAAESFEEFGDDEELEPICSPPLAAAGLEGLQLQLYPLGSIARDDMQIWSPTSRRVPGGSGKRLCCGLFLICPGGTYVKCRAFVGDASRTFDHHYATREPFGINNFCRLSDKIRDDDFVTCGIEFLEVRHERPVKVHGGAFGNVADHLKVTFSPNLAGMETVRELREVKSGPGSHLQEDSSPTTPEFSRHTRISKHSGFGSHNAMRRSNSAPDNGPWVARKPSGLKMTDTPFKLPAAVGAVGGPRLAIETATD